MGKEGEQGEGELRRWIDPKAFSDSRVEDGVVRSKTRGDSSVGDGVSLQDVSRLDDDETLREREKRKKREREEGPKGQFGLGEVETPSRKRATHTVDGDVAGIEVGGSGEGDDNIGRGSRSDGNEGGREDDGRVARDERNDVVDLDSVL